MEINIREIVEKEVNRAVGNIEKLERDRKGYAFDSLVFRFKEYQHKAEEGDIYEFMQTRKCHRDEAIQRVKDRHNRDLMRFIQILDDVIGDHS